tara:strand:+ start:61 stop:561 length:501 start_codon:yes stop_codon:yes gene_type:complete
MNIFYFDHDPVVCAKAQPDKMLVKMPLETAQMLCTAHRVLDGDKYADEVGLYKEAYKNHPCTIWARESVQNYSWLYRHFIALGDEYTYRYNKVHGSVEKLKDALMPHPENISSQPMTPIRLAMPDQYKEPDDPILSYRQYCIQEKDYAMWNKGRPKPTWWKSSFLR